MLFLQFPQHSRGRLCQRLTRTPGHLGIWLSPTRSKAVNLAHFSVIYRFALGVIGAWLGCGNNRERLKRVDLPHYGLAISTQSQTRPAPAELLKVRHWRLNRFARFPRGDGCEG